MAGKKWDTRIAATALAVSALTLGWTLYTNLVVERNRQKLNRSIEEVNRIYDPVFAERLSRILDESYEFYESELNTLSGSKRFEAFWNSVDESKGNVAMMIIQGRLQSIVDCLLRNECNAELIFSKFPSPIYQALVFLREFIFLPQAQSGSMQLNGWWLDDDIQSFLSRYCVWYTGPNGRMPTWSPFHERLQADAGVPELGKCISGIR